MSSGPRISVVVPNFNSGPYLERALASIFSQSYTNYELIVSDSASTDESAQTLDRHRDRIHVLLREKDRGQADGLNRGFARASGDVFCWLCADDELLPGAFEYVAQSFAAQPEIDVVVGGCERIYADGAVEVTTPPHNVFERIGYMDLIEQPSCFWRADLHRHCGPLDDSFHLVFDWDFWCRMKRAGARAAITDRVLSRYHFSADNKTSTSGVRFVEEASRVLQRYGPLRGNLALIYRALFRFFDLHGCYDRPPSCSPVRRYAFVLTIELLRRAIGPQLTYSYNWHFAACQARGMKWW